MKEAVTNSREVGSVLNSVDTEQGKSEVSPIPVTVE